MADIPTLSGPQVQQTPIPGVRVPTDAPIAAFGGGPTAQALTSANEGMQEHVQQFVSEEKRKADQIAHMVADRQASELETNLQVAVSKMKGQDALKAPDYIQDGWQKGVQQINEGLSNQDQKIAFMRSSNARWESLNKTTQMHVANESQQLDTNETQGYIDSSRSSAVLNAFDDQRVQTEIARQQAVYQDYAKRQGLTGTETEKAKLADITSGTYRSVIQARLDAGQDDKAKDLFNEVKSTMNAQDQLTVESALKQNQLLKEGDSAWSAVKDLKLANGQPDEAKMRSVIFSKPDLGTAEKEKVWDYVKARSGEEISNQAREAQARDRGFLNQVLQGKKQGAPLSDAMKLAQKTGIDPYEQNIFADAARKIYDPGEVKSDQSLYINLWERVQDGGASRAEIDQAWQKGQLSNSDWQSLRKDWYKIKTSPETDPSIKDAWERVKDLAEQNFGNKQDRDNFLYVLHNQFRDRDGVAPEQIIKGAQDSLKTVGQHPWLGISFMPSWGTGEVGWKADLKKTDAANLAWGTAYQDLGKDAVDAFRDGVQFQSKREATPSDLNSFAEQYGGYQNVKPGTPVHNAILSIQKAGRPVVPANIEWVLKKYPDGIMR